MSREGRTRVQSNGINLWADTGRQGRLCLSNLRVGKFPGVPVNPEHRRDNAREEMTAACGAILTQPSAKRRFITDTPRTSLEHSRVDYQVSLPTALLPPALRPFGLRITMSDRSLTAQAGSSRMGLDQRDIITAVNRWQIELSALEFIDTTGPIGKPGSVQLANLRTGTGDLVTVAVKSVKLTDERQRKVCSPG